MAPERPASEDALEIANDLRDTAEELTRHFGFIAADMAIVASRVEHERNELLEEVKELCRLLRKEQGDHRDDIQILNEKLAAEREARATADRNRERFRYALWVYLQERDGVLGIHAPSHDTLKLIRELIKELE